MRGPLEGYRVIDTSQMISGPVATRILGDQGADVIKVEIPGVGDIVRGMGDKKANMSATFATANRNKRSVCLNLKKARGLELLMELVKSADVFFQNFRPGTAERMGIGYQDLAEANPALIYVSISGFGEKGPYKHKRVYDPIVQAMSGLAAIQKNRETGRPNMVRAIIPDKLTAMTAAQAATAALLARVKTGKGQHIRVSMLDSMISFLWPESMSNYTIVDQEPGPTREDIAQDLIFETRDGYITVGTVSDSEWIGWSRAIKNLELANDARFNTVGGRIKNVVARLDLMAQELKNKTTAEWLEILDVHEVPCAPVLSREEVVNFPQVVANELIFESVHPIVGRIRQARGAARFEETPGTELNPAPYLGEHTDEVLAELGLSQEQINILRQNNIVD
ncbi:MAG: CoA transferase [SAR324 cluster bacterium]|nr:CoA transferase [SAR324 cluster bacterium]